MYVSWVAVRFNKSFIDVYKLNLKFRKSIDFRLIPTAIEKSQFLNILITVFFFLSRSGRGKVWKHLERYLDLNKYF